MQGQAISADEVQELAKLPPVDVLRGQVLGAIAAPVYTIVGLLSAPLRDLHGLIQARIDQLGGETAEAPAEPEAEADEEPKAAETTPQAAPQEAEGLGDNPADSSPNGGEAAGLESAEEEE
jgi:hypothetical protein